MTKSDDYADFAISEDESGKHAVGHGMVVTVDGDGRIFHRRCIKMPMGQVSEEFQKRDSILVAEVDGVRVFIKPPGNIIVTKKDLML